MKTHSLEEKQIRLQMHEIARHWPTTQKTGVMANVGFEPVDAAKCWLRRSIRISARVSAKNCRGSTPSRISSRSAGPRITFSPPACDSESDTSVVSDDLPSIAERKSLTSGSSSVCFVRSRNTASSVPPFDCSTSSFVGESAMIFPASITTTR